MGSPGMAEGNGLRRLLVINPNTNRAVTERIRAVSERIVEPGTAVTVVNPETGPYAVETVEDRQAALPGVLALVAGGRQTGFDAYVLACFDDIGLDEAREMVDVPVVGACEAGIAAARSLARRFTIVTTVATAVPVIHALLRRYGVEDICTVRAAGVTVAEAAEPAGKGNRRLAAAIRLALEQDEAGAILLGSGGLTGRAAELAAGIACPVVDSVAAAVKMAEGLVFPGVSFRSAGWASHRPTRPNSKTSVGRDNVG